MQLPLLLPLLLPLGTAALCLLAWHRRSWQRRISIVGVALLLAAALHLLYAVWQRGILAVQVGNWPAPFGITLVADLFSAIMVVLAALMGVAVTLYSLVDIDPPRETFGYHPLVHFLLMGVCGAFLTGDLFNLYVWFEVMLMASFVLMALGGEKAQLAGAIKYVVLNLVASALFISAVGILYGMVGTLNMADLSLQLPTAPPALVNTVAILFLGAFGIKAAIFPLFFWLPASYHTPPVPVSALFAGMLTKVGVYALIRVFTLLFTLDIAYTHSLILAAAVLTMVTGVLGAVAHNEFRRILSFHIISQVGYMILGLGLFTRLALAGSIFYIIHHIIVKTNLFLISGVAFRLRGSFELGRLGGLYQSAPGLSFLFLIAALSLAGVPPLSGFWAKLVLIQASLRGGHFLVAAIALLVGLLTLYSMIKIWRKAFWREEPVGRINLSPLPVSRRDRFLYYLPVALLALCTVAIGLLAEPVFLLSARAAEQLIDPAPYQQAVLGRSR